MTSRGSSFGGPNRRTWGFRSCRFFLQEARTRQKAFLDRAQSPPLPAVSSGGPHHARYTSCQPAGTGAAVRAGRLRKREKRQRSAGFGSGSSSRQKRSGGSPSGRASEDGSNLHCRPKQVTAKSPTSRLNSGQRELRRDLERLPHRNDDARSRGAHLSVVTVRGRQYRLLATSDPGAADHPRPRRHAHETR